MSRNIKIDRVGFAFAYLITKQTYSILISTTTPYPFSQPNSELSLAALGQSLDTNHIILSHLPHHRRIFQSHLQPQYHPSVPEYPHPDYHTQFSHLKYAQSFLIIEFCVLLKY